MKRTLYDYDILSHPKPSKYVKAIKRHDFIKAYTKANAIKKLKEEHGSTVVVVSVKRWKKVGKHPWDWKQS